MTQGIEVVLIALLASQPQISYQSNPHALEYVARQFEQSKVVSVGESDHSSKAQKEFIKSLIPYLKRAGVTHFGAELPVEYSESIRKYLESDREYRDENIESLLEWGPANDHLEIAYQFHKAGITVVPIDVIIPMELISGNDGTRLVNNDKDSHMANNMKKIFEENPSAKVFTYAGAFHTAEQRIEWKFRDGKKDKVKHPPFACILKEQYGIDPITIYLMDHASRHEPRFQAPFGLDNGRFKDAQHPDDFFSDYRFDKINDGYVNLNPTKHLKRGYRPQRTIPKSNK